MFASVRSLCSYVYGSDPSHSASTTPEGHTKVKECSAPVLSPQEIAQTVASEPLNNRSIQQCNELSAALASFLSQVLIERTFFQNKAVSPTALLYLANDLMRTLSPPEEHTETLSVRKELAITWKQLRGQQLTAEEQAYDNSPKEIDVVGEILTGVSLSTTALLGKNLVGSLQSAIRQGFWDHVPAIVASTGAALFGSKAIAYAVDEVLARTSYTQEQKQLIRPWLNMIGRLAIGFTPKVHATETGVHYQYPSMAGSSQTFSKGQVTTAHGDNLRIEKDAFLNTTEGKIKGVHAADFKLRKVYELTDERMRIQVVDLNGTEVPVEFKRIDRGFGPEIEVVCDDQQIAAYFTQVIQPPEAAPQINPSDSSNCHTSLAIGAMGMLATQNILPFALAAMDCAKRVHAETLESRLTTACPLSFDLSKPDPTKFFTITATQSQANIRFTIAGIGDVNRDGIADFAVADPAAATPGGIQGAGKVRIFYGGPNVASSSPGKVFYGLNQFDQLGYSIVGLGNFRGDGKNAIGLGAANNGFQNGHFYILLDPQNTSTLSTCDGTTNCVAIDGSPDDGLGACAAGGLDISGDGKPDVIVGAPGISKLYGFFGGSGPLNYTNLDGSNGFVGQLPSSSILGCPVTMGVMQNNTIAAFAVAAKGIGHSGLTNPGNFYFFKGGNVNWPGGNLNFAVDGTPKGFSAYGQNFENVPGALSIGGDFDQDGNTDVLATASSGKLYDIFRQPNPSNTPLDLGPFNGTNAGSAIPGPQPTSGGASIALIDINNDGYLDVAIGMTGYSPNAGLTNAGGILFILGQPGGLPTQLDFTSSNSSLFFIVPGVIQNGRLGAFVANVGDVNGDGRDDLGISSINSGDVDILLGQPPTCPTTTTTTSASSTTSPPASNTIPIAVGVGVGVAVVAGATVGTVFALRHYQKACWADKDAEPTQDFEKPFDEMQ